MLYRIKCIPSTLCLQVVSLVLIHQGFYFPFCQGISLNSKLIYVIKEQSNQVTYRGWLTITSDCIYHSIAFLLWSYWNMLAIKWNQTGWVGTSQNQMVNKYTFLISEWLIKTLKKIFGTLCGELSQCKPQMYLKFCVIVALLDGLTSF